jgi:hypothetical protein
MEFPELFVSEWFRLEQPEHRVFLHVGVVRRAF